MYFCNCSPKQHYFFFCYTCVSFNRRFWIYNVRGWVRYILPCFFLSAAVYMFWHKHHSGGKPIQVFQVTPPPNRNPVELLLMLQEGVSQLQTNVRTGTISLLKIRALLLAAFPKVCLSSNFQFQLILPAIGCIYL